ncbi:glycoside hydrolase family 88/105 protein [Anaerotalea alkaliphila]|uniref:Glycoside hydrolase family 105 protein n=1 Tax=Anaerotalea alkaliphila TaxID=2662126 RepID=A0A7X5HUT9_9FIRM|nr:glycoside hydrolase family 88 protein [Anaerotalea alkaliphila]NDL67065.1 glycoside hydrolase family 105 protein [Anaerotalea alkaliphila]
MAQVDHTALLGNIEKVVRNMMEMGDANYEEDKTTGAAAIKQGLIARDFGIMEWDWPQGVGLYGLDILQRCHGDNRYDTFLAHWFTANIKKGLPSRNINTTAPYLTLLGFARRTGNKEYEDMCIRHADWLLRELPKTKEGGFQHVTSAIGDRHGVQLNDGEMWIDTLFMAVLFLAKMGRTYGRKDWQSEALKQVLVHIKYLYDIHTGLFFHGWSFNRNDHFGGVFWCRGNSWFTFGIMDYLEIVGDTIDEGVRDYIIDTYKAQVAALSKCQSSSGLWHTVLTDPTSYEEVSGSAAIAKGMLKGVKLGLLDESHASLAWKAISALIGNIDNNGTVLNVSAGTGMGHDADHYKNILKAPMAYGQSLALAALAEAL